jgi:signal transduction histidine kinase
MLIQGSSSQKNLRYILTIFLLLLAGCISALYVYKEITTSLQLHVLDRARTIALAVEPEKLKALSGTDKDLENPAYRQVKTLLTHIKEVNSDVRFIYILGQTQTKEVFFYADSEHPSSPDYSPPGQQYTERATVINSLFETINPNIPGPYKDRWGTWITGYAPIKNSDGEVEALLAVDLPAKEYFITVGVYSFLPLLVFLFLVLVYFIYENARRKEKNILDQKSEFLSIASHEIRSPLTGISWALGELLKKEEIPKDSKARPIVELIHENTQGLISRVNNLLSITALTQKGKKALARDEIHIDPFFKELIRSLLLSAQARGISLVVSSIDSTEVFIADTQMMRHAFFNLLTNAIKYTKENTNINITYVEKEKIHEFSIIDQGSGISTEEQEKIFEGYYRTKSARVGNQYGTGLGLHLARESVRLHGGDITIISKLGEGSTFTVTVPK